MADMSGNLVSLVVRGARTDPALKDEAFRLWIENGRSYRRVSELVGCDERTIYRWAEEGNWQVRRLEQAQSFLPGARAETAFALKLAAHNASLRLQQIAWEANERGIKPDAKEVQALTMIVDRGGYSPVGSRNPIDGDQHLGSDQDNAPDFHAMSIDQLRQYELSKRKRRHSE